MPLEAKRSRHVAESGAAVFVATYASQQAASYDITHLTERVDQVHAHAAWGALVWARDYHSDQPARARLGCWD
jgi:hypothetical protein